MKKKYIFLFLVLLQSCFFSPQQNFYRQITKLNNKELPSVQTLVFESYIVQQGDSLADIAKKKNLRIDTLISANPHIKKYHSIIPKTIIKIPNINGIFEATSKKEEKKSTKSKQEELNELSEKYNICQNQIFFYNLTTENIFFIPHTFYSFENRSDLFGYPFLSPINNRFYRISSHFGFRIHPIKKVRKKHQGIDLAAPKGTMVYASKAGVVQVATYSPSYGNLVVIKHSKGYRSYYAHLSAILVKKNSKVYTGQLIGKVGNTGSSTGNHLHFEIRKNGIPINPKNLADLRKKKKKI